ncbi:UNVERIFIED_CONTAM: hypothetical protein Sindi_0996800 [Sesamum indicum]
MVGDVGAEVVEEWVLGAVGEEVEIELGREVADVDPSVGAVRFKIGVLGGYAAGEEELEDKEEEKEECGGGWRWHGGGVEMNGGE